MKKMKSIRVIAGEPPFKKPRKKNPRVTVSSKPDSSYSSPAEKIERTSGQPTGTVQLTLIDEHGTTGGQPPVNHR